MSHPVVKKLLRNELLLWCLGTLVVVVLPLGVVVLEATTRSGPAKSTTVSHSAKSTTVSQSTKKTTVSQSAKKTKPRDVASQTPEVLGKVEGSTASDTVLTSDTVLSEVASDLISSGIPYFGGESSDDIAGSAGNIAGGEVGTVKTAASGVGVTVPIEVGAGGIGSVPSESKIDGSAVADQPTSKGSSNTPADSEQSDPDLVTLLSAGSETSLEMPKPSQTADNASEKPGESEAASHERTEVTLIRPKGDMVKSFDELIFRCRTKGKSIPFVLVRSRQQTTVWWVQDDTIRQGMYVRGRAQFGNKATTDGSRFSVVVAFVDDIEDVPEGGTQLSEIPLNVLLSQELEFTLTK
jgi:hypothetical protein